MGEKLNGDKSNRIEAPDERASTWAWADHSSRSAAMPRLARSAPRIAWPGFSKPVQVCPSVLPGWERLAPHILPRSGSLTNRETLP